jgi:hypothetical protein
LKYAEFKHKAKGQKKDGNTRKRILPPPPA